MASRRLRDLTALTVLALAVLAFPTASAASLPAGFTPVAETTGAPVALHGAELVWLGLDQTLHLTNLTSAATKDLTMLPAGAHLQAVAYDGTWVAWCDNRFGDLEVFVIDVHSLELTRLSKDPAPDTDVTVGGGHAAWLRSGVLYGTDLPGPSVRRLSFMPGQALTPTLDGDHVIWSQVVGGERHLAGLAWGHNATILTAAASTVEGNPVAANGRVAWLGEVYSGAPAARGSHLLGSQILLADIGDGPLHAVNLTGLGPHSAPRMGGAWVAWLEAEGSNGMTALNLDTGSRFEVLVGVLDAQVSATHLVVAPSDGALQARAWASTAHKALAPGIAWMAPLVLASAVASRRR